MIIIRFLSKKR